MVRKPKAVSALVLASPKLWEVEIEAGRGVKQPHHVNGSGTRVRRAVEALGRTRVPVADVYAPQVSDGVVRTAREILDDIDRACTSNDTVLVYLIGVIVLDMRSAPILVTGDGGLSLNDVCEHISAGATKSTRILMIDCLVEEETDSVADGVKSILRQHPELQSFAVVAPFSNWLAQILPELGHRPAEWARFDRRPPKNVRYVRSEAEETRNIGLSSRNPEWERLRKLDRSHRFPLELCCDISGDPGGRFYSREVGKETVGTRSVNAMILTPSSGAVVHGDAALSPNADYLLVVDIGHHEKQSLLPEGDGRWPGAWLPDGDLKLRAVLDMASANGPVVRALMLPQFEMASRGCHCWPDHEQGCRGGSYVEFPLRTPDLVDGVWKGVLAIYYGAVAVHVQELVLPVSSSPHSAHGGVRARLLYRLTSDFTDVGPLAERVASVFISGAVGGRAIVNGLPFVDNPVSINVNAADIVARAARRLLYDQHLENTPAGPKARADYGKPFTQFVDDLAGLARLGWTMYNRMFADNVVFDSMSGLIRHEARARGRAPVLNIADASAGDDPGRTSVPWSLVYDLPMPHDPAGEYRVCESVRAFGPGGKGRAVPAVCPESDHSGNVLCPFGFWGLSCLIEQPPRVDHLIRRVSVERTPPALAVAVDEKLAPQLTARHLAELAEIMTADSLRVATVRKPLDLAELLAGDWMDIAYLYCHGGYSTGGDRSFSAELRFGDSIIAEGDIAGWRLPGGPWGRGHWATRKPVVVLNGCHTAEFTSASLSSLVQAFVNRAGASAVIGTEVTVEQGAAGWATRQLLEQILSTETSVGQALRALRWQLMGRGTTLGLAYTLHGVADLRLRPDRQGAAS